MTCNLPLDQGLESTELFVDGESDQTRRRKGKALEGGRNGQRKCRQQKEKYNETLKARTVYFNVK
jgi:hypothetical protein